MLTLYHVLCVCIFCLQLLVRLFLTDLRVIERFFKTGLHPTCHRSLAALRISFWHLSLSILLFMSLERKRERGEENIRSFIEAMNFPSLSFSSSISFISGRKVDFNANSLKICRRHFSL